MAGDELTPSRIRVPVRAVASLVEAPVIRQRLRNNCESAALSVLLASRGRRVGQLELQRELPRSGPLDPLGSGAAKVWGDPELGFVGRPDGGGTAGGFGVYQQPIARISARHRARLTDLTGRSPGMLYRALLGGRAVMAWVGLASGPYGRWRSPTGRVIRVNFNEHAIVLVGVAPSGGIRVIDPLTGKRGLWSRSRFEEAWAMLGRRALA